MQAASRRWSVYLARCADGTLYTGISLDAAARIAAHDAGRGARYTRGRGPLTLCAVSRCASKGDALRLERALKRLPRIAKEALTQQKRMAAFVRRWLAARRAGQAVDGDKPRLAAPRQRTCGRTPLATATQQALRGLPHGALAGPE